MNKKFELSPRLNAIAGEVRSNVTLYDVGTDHAYLPVALVTSGKINCAVASDIASGPLKRARENIIENGAEGKISTVQTPGLDGILLDEKCDIVIAGMGGELIASVIGGKPEVTSGDKRLILQPMTKVPYLRRYLADNGFKMIKEVTVYDVKYYNVIVCTYTGDVYPLTDEELAVGQHGVRTENADFYGYVKNKCASMQCAVNGKKSAGIDCTSDDALIETLKKLVSEKRGEQG